MRRILERVEYRKVIAVSKNRCSKLVAPFHISEIDSSEKKLHAIRTMKSVYPGDFHSIPFNYVF